LIEHGAFHGIGSYAKNNGIENKGLFMLVYNQVGIAGSRSTAANGLPGQHLAVMP